MVAKRIWSEEDSWSIDATIKTDGQIEFKRGFKVRKQSI